MNLALSIKRLFIFMALVTSFGSSGFMIAAEAPALAPEAEVTEATIAAQETVDTSETAAPTPKPTPGPEPIPAVALEAVPTPVPTPTVPTAPSPVPEKKEMKPLPPETGIDTIDIEEGGNWLLKRKALEDTADIIEKIINNFSKILEASTTYKIKRNKLDNEYDLYIATVGFNLGDLDQVLTNLLEDLEKERREDGELTVQEREALVTINEKKNDIKQLQEDLKALAAIDQEIDKAVDIVDGQIKTANNYQNQAWKNFQEIKKVLSDEKAEELYYRTVSLQKSMEDIYTYLTGALSTYFSNQIDTMRNQMDTIKGKIRSLQAKGIDLQKKIAEFEKEDEQREQEELKKQEEEVIEKALQQAKIKREKEGWWQSIKSVLYWPFAQIANLWNYTTGVIMNLFKPKKKLPSPQPLVKATIATKEETAKKDEATKKE